MKGFLVNLSDQHRVALETYRARHGLRSASDAVRHLIEGAEEPPKPALMDGRGKPAKLPDPRPAFKSRLKGEWKVP